MDNLGREYLARVDQMDPMTRAMALSSYEDGGLETVFRAILTAPDWDEPSLGAFRHFLVEHIRLDSGSMGPCAGTSSLMTEFFHCGPRSAISLLELPLVSPIRGARSG